MAELLKEIALEVPKHLPGALAVYVAIVGGIAYLAARAAEDSARTAFAFLVGGLVVGALLFPSAYRYARSYCDSKRIAYAGTVIGYSDEKCASVFPLAPSAGQR